MASLGNQNTLALAFGVHNAPQDAPPKLVRQIENDAQAVAVSIKAGGHKLAYVAAVIGKSEGYVSRLKTGKRPVPDTLVAPLCAATGTNLLAQFRALQAALAESTEAVEVERLAALLRAEAQAA